DGIPRTAISGGTVERYRPRPPHRTAEGRSRRLQRMDARPCDDAARRAAAEHRSAVTPAAPAHVSRCVSGATPGSHLLRRACGGDEARLAADAAGAHGIGSSAAGRGAEDPVSLALSLFFVFFFF